MPGASPSVRRRMKWGLISLSTRAVSRACCSQRSRPPRPGMTYSESSNPASRAFLPPAIISAAVAPFST